MSEKPRRDFKSKQNKGDKRTFYKSTSKKDTTKSKSGNIVRKRNPENELVGIYKQGQ
jgi:hypothetical protein